MVSQCWYLEEKGTRLPIVFVTRREAVQYADENLEGEYVLVFDHHLRGEKKTPMMSKERV